MKQITQTFLEGESPTLIILLLSLGFVVDSTQKFLQRHREIYQVNMFQKSMLPQKKVKLKKSPEINLLWMDDDAQLLLESVRNFKTQKAGEGIGWQSVKEKYEKTKDIFRKSLPQQLNENEISSLCTHFSFLSSSAKVFLCFLELGTSLANYHN